MPAKKFIPWIAAGFVLFYLLRSPEAAARSVESAAGGLAAAADSLATFVNTLAS
ncbi:MAG: hypothetical protein ACRDOO_07075 [Actinomadura sp.]